MAPKWELPVCKNLQAVPEEGAAIGLDGRVDTTADPDLPRSAAFCCYSCLLVTVRAGRFDS